MNHIAEQLRRSADKHAELGTSDLIVKARAAADEIDRLQAELNERCLLEKELVAWRVANECLRAALRPLIDFLDGNAGSALPFETLQSARAALECK